MNKRIINSPEARYRIMRLERERARHEQELKEKRDRLLALDGDKIREVIMNGSGTQRLPSGNGTIKVNISGDDSKFREALMHRSSRVKPMDTPFGHTFKPYKRESY